MRAKLLLNLIVGFLLISCSVEPIEENLMRNPVEAVDAGIDDYGCAGKDGYKSITYSEASAIESWDEVRKLYLSLLEIGVSRNGTFDPSIWEIIRDFQVRGIGEYSTTYTLSGECSDTAILTINVVPDPTEDPIDCEGVSAGNDASLNIELSDAAAIESWDEVRKLFLSLLDPDVPRNGSFDPSIWDLINAFNDAEDPLGAYTTIYTITEGDCSDSVELTVVVIPDEFEEPVCELNAGEDKLIEMSRSNAAAIESWDEVRKLYLSLLEPGVPRNGSFDPSIWTLINRFNEPGDNLGDYSTTYTITDGECNDSVILTIRVIAD